jgi:hypothetical protein
MLKTFAVMPSVALASVRKLRRPIGRVLRRAFVDEASRASHSNWG